MTQDQAVLYLREYRQFSGHVYHESDLYRHMKPRYEAICYRRFLVSEMIRRIKDSETDPIRTVKGVISELEYILGEADDDHFITHRFAAIMEHESGYILRYLKAKEKMSNE